VLLRERLDKRGVKMKIETPDKMELISSKSYRVLQKLVQISRFVFISILILYLLFSLYRLIIKLFNFLSSSHYLLTFEEMREFLTDALFVLIVIDFISAMFYRKRIHYVLSLLEIGFIVITRKLILLSPVPENSFLIFVLTVASGLFFILIFYFYKVTGRIRRGD
jgi:magnesium-transporting ATPase (P-type)